LRGGSIEPLFSSCERRPEGSLAGVARSSKRMGFSVIGYGSGRSASSDLSAALPLAFNPRPLANAITMFNAPPIGY